MSAKCAFFGVLQKIVVICCAIFFGFANAFAANLPAGYTELEYIESTGTQYIDTGYKPKTGDKIRIVYQYNSLTGGGSGYDAVAIFGCTDEASATDAGNGVARVIQWENAINRIAWGSGTNSVVGNLTYNSATGVWYDLVCDNGVFTINDTQLGTTSANSFSANFSMYLFARNTGGTAGLITKGKIQIAQIWDNGTLVRNMVPAKNSSGVVGMYDTVNDVFYQNAGTGTFTAGPVVVTNSGAISSVTVAGLVAQNGTPTPNTPVAINTNNGVVKVSKNLFDVNNVEIQANTSIATDGSLVTNALTKVCMTYLPVKPNTTYTISGDVLGGDSGAGNAVYFRLVEYTSSKQFITRGAGVLGSSYTFTTGADTYFVRFHCLTRADLNTYQLEQGSTATPYHPYGQIYTDGEVETIADSANHTANVATLLGIGDYRDTQNINTGAITRNVGVKVLDGTESFVTNVITGCYALKPYIGAGNFGDKTVYSSHLKSTAAIPAFGSRDGYAFIVNAGDDYTLAFGGTGTWSSLSAFKQFLAEQYAAGTPVIVVYPLKTPTTESVAGQTMTTAPVDNRTGGVTGMTITTLLSSGASVVTTIAANAIKIATTAYNTARFSPVVNDLNTTIATIRDIVTNTINQTAAIASLQADKQTRPDEQCPAGKKCLLVETEENGVIVPHWFPIIEVPED